MRIYCISILMLFSATVFGQNIYNPPAGTLTYNLSPIILDFDNHFTYTVVTVLGCETCNYTARPNQTNRYPLASGGVYMFRLDPNMYDKVLTIDFISNSSISFNADLTIWGRNTPSSSWQVIDDDSGYHYFPQATIYGDQFHELAVANYNIGAGLQQGLSMVLSVK